jgi:uncharacterized protein (TIGR02145 family)
MIRLYIENQEADTTQGFSHQITYAVDDLQNLDSKATAFSKTIVLPGTAKNNYLLGNIFEFANSNFTGEGPNVGYNFNASKSAKCRLEINGLQIIKGVLRLMEIIRDGDSIEYEVAIFGELGGFFTSLGNKKLTDLDFSLYNHYYETNQIKNFWQDGYYAFDTLTDSVLVNGSPAYIDIYEDVREYIQVNDVIQVFKKSNYNSYGQRTVTNITWDGEKTHIEVSSNWSPAPTTSFVTIIRVNNKKGYGVYYPLIDYGNYSTDKKNYKLKTFRPALHVLEYMDKIIKEAGYTWESKFFNTDFFKRLIIPHNESILNTLKQDILGGNIYGSYLSEYTIYQYVTFSKLYGDLFTTTDDITYTYTGSNTNVKITGVINTQLYLYTQNFSFYVRVFKNSTQIFSQRVDTFGQNTFQYSTINLDIDTSIDTNDTITVRTLVINGTADYIFGDLNGKIYINSLFPVVAPVNFNDIVEMSQSIPKNYLQKDFFASILKMFYLMVTEDKFKDKHLKIEPWTWFYNLNSDSYLDWSLKLDRSQPIRIKPMSEANARFYDIKFKSDNDYFNEFYRKRYNEGYGDVRFDNQLEFAKDAETTDVIFSSTPLLGYSGKDKIVPTILKWDGKVAGTNEETVNSNIRILQKKYIDEVTSWDILGDTGNVLSSNVYYPYAGHFDNPDAPNSDLNFGATKQLFFNLTSGALGNNLFNTFYSSYLAEITDKDSRLVTAKFKLNDTDIFNLDFGRFIYLDGVLYRLSRVVDYTPGEICTVELLRVIYTTYDNTVNGSDDPEVNINGQIWKVKNLDTEYYNNGDQIPQITDETEWNDTTEGAWCYYENITSNGIEYGKLYNWYAVNDARGLAPDGWEIPSELDFKYLADFSNGSNELKEVGTAHWNNGNGTDDFGFKALGAGRRRYNGPFDELKTNTYYWTRDNYDTDLAFYARIQDISDTFTTNKIDKNYGFSIRLIKQ